MTLLRIMEPREQANFLPLKNLNPSNPNTNFLGAAVNSLKTKVKGAI
jgi:hypothetical protein